jgi:branched-subunit amino acid ABC-type transport system permease component
MIAGLPPLGEYPSLAASSVMLAAVYVPVSLSWTLIFRATKVLNFATGQFLLLGTYLYYALIAEFHWPLYGALLGSLVVIAGLGALCYALLLRPLTGLGLFGPVILLLGVGIVITNVTAIIWGPSNRILPDFFTDHNYHLPGGIVVDTVSIGTFVVALISIAFLLFTLRYTQLGVQMKAAAEHPTLASQSGIRISVIYAIAWAVACILGTLAGITYAYTNILGAPLADNVGNLGIAPALIGGLGSVPGAIVGGILVGFAETFGTAFFGGAAADAVVWLILLCVLIFRPQGILGTPLVERV